MMTIQSGTGWIEPAECVDIAKLLDRKFTGLRKQRFFEASVTKDGQGVYVKVTLRDDSGSYYYPVEARCAHADSDLSERDTALFLLDYIGEYFAEYFREDGEVFLPIDWTDQEWDGMRFQIKGQILNLALEKMADALLSDDAAGHTSLN